MAKLTYPIVQQYLMGLVPVQEQEIQDMEKYAANTDFPILGSAAGCVCYQIAPMINARSVFEMESGFCYSTAWFAKALLENGGGVVHQVIWDDELSKMATVFQSRDKDMVGSSVVTISKYSRSVVHI
jgi:caffeoyl-CoA O-methyltransferase